jgi:hypothetical protein
MLSAIRATLSIQSGSYIHKRSIWRHQGSKARTENHNECVVYRAIRTAAAYLTQRSFGVLQQV